MPSPPEPGSYQEYAKAKVEARAQEQKRKHAEFLIQLLYRKTLAYQPSVRASALFTIPDWSFIPPMKRIILRA